MTNDMTESLVGTQVTLRSTRPSDIPRLFAIVTTPEVARWWGTFTLERAQEELLASDDGTAIYAITLTDRIIGLIQFYEENDPNYRRAGIDIFLDPAYHGRGLGSDAIRTVARHLFNERGHHRLIIDPAATNTHAIRTYERVGFRPVGLMRQYERGPDGTWHDGLLMDMLRPELTDPTK